VENGETEGGRMKRLGHLIRGTFASLNVDTEQVFLSHLSESVSLATSYAAS
jgi:hypothetical protein